MCTINNFLAYDLLSEWFIPKRLTYPIYMEDTRAFTLKYRGKQLWLDCHRYFLGIDHVYMRNKIAFYKNKIKKSLPPN